MKNNYLLLLLKKEKFLLALSMLIALGLFIFCVILPYKPSYTSEVKLYIRNIPQNDVVTSYRSPGSVSSESGYSNPLFNLSQVLQSEKLSDRVYQDVLQHYPQDLKTLGIKNKESWSDYFRTALTVKIEPSTDIMIVKFGWVNRMNAKAILAEVVREFKVTNLEIQKSIETGQRESLAAESKQIGSELDEVRTNIRNFRVKNGVSNLDNEQNETLSARIQFQQQADQIKSQRDLSQAKYDSLAKQLGVSDAGNALRASGVGSDPFLVKLSQDLAAAQQKYDSLHAKYKDTYPEVISAKNEITSLQDNIQKRTTETLGGKSLNNRAIYDSASLDLVRALAQAKADTISYQKQYDSLLNSAKQRQSSLSGLATKIQNYDELQKKEPALEDAYKSVQQKYLEALINEQDVVDNVIALSSPSTPESSLKLLFIKLLGTLAIGFLGGLGLAWIKNGYEDRWLNAHEVALMTQREILGNIPWIPNRYYQSSAMELFHRSNPYFQSAYNGISSKILTKALVLETPVIACLPSLVTRPANRYALQNIARATAQAGTTMLLLDLMPGTTPSSLVNESVKTPLRKPGKKLASRLNKDKDIVSEDYEGPVLEGGGGLDIVELITAINTLLRTSDSSEPDHKTDNKVDMQIDELLNQAVIALSVTEYEQFYYLGLRENTPQLHTLLRSKGYKALLHHLRRRFELVLIDTPAKSIAYPEVAAAIESSDAVLILSTTQTGNRNGLMNLLDKLDKLEKPVLGVITRDENTELNRVAAEEKQYAAVGA